MNYLSTSAQTFVELKLISIYFPQPKFVVSRKKFNVSLGTHCAQLKYLSLQPHYGCHLLMGYSKNHFIQVKQEYYCVKQLVSATKLNTFKQL